MPETSSPATRCAPDPGEDREEPAARVFQIPVRTLQKWETGQGKPTGATATLLRVIAANPRVVEKALEKTA